MTTQSRKIAINTLKNTIISDHLNAIRGVAAMLVVFAHLRAGFFIPYKELTSPTLYEKIIFIITGWGNEAVIVFFVLSGFLVGTSSYCEIRNNTYSWTRYLINRFVRLYIVLLPTLAFSFFVIYFCYPNASENANQLNISLQTLMTNVFFLQSRPDTYAMNIPLWSLSNEFWYYMIFPCVALLLYQPNNLLSKTFYCFTLLLIFFLIGAEKSLYFIIWLMGVIVYLIKPISILTQSVLLRKIIAVIPLTCLFGAFVLSHLYPEPKMVSDFITAFSFSIFLYLILHNHNVSQKDWYHVFATRTSGCSYTLYLIHYPLIILITKLIHVDSNWTFDAFHILLAALVFVLIFTIAHCFALVTEYNTDKVRKFLSRTVESSSLSFLFGKSKLAEKKDTSL